jgi:predicted phosphodiesterase
MTLKRLAAYLPVCLLAGFVLTHSPADILVNNANNESTDHAILIGGPMVQIGNTDGFTSIVIAWRTRDKSDSRVDYGESASYGRSVIIDELTDYHAVLLPNLQPNKQHHYQITSNNKVLASAVFQSGKVNDTPFKFAVFGDSGSGSPAQYAVAQQIEAHAVDFIIHTGDVVYPKGSDQDYRERFYIPYKNLLARFPFFPAIGNHDIKTSSGQPWLNNFVLPGEERFYSFSYGNAFFVALDSYYINLKSARWLEAQLTRTDNLWKFIFFHKPPFSNHKNRYGSADAIRLWLPLFEKYKVAVVFSGHDHMYTRFEPKNGVHYIVEGLGGSSFQEINPKAKGVLFTNNTEYGFGLVKVAGDKLTFQHITANGTVLDAFTLTKQSAVATPAGR